MSDETIKQESAYTDDLDLDRYQELLDEDLEEVAGGNSSGFHKTLVVNQHSGGKP
jgi:hypothetical protein